MAAALDILTATPLAPDEHFRVLFYSAVLEIMHHLAGAFDSAAEAYRRFPFLEGYCVELAGNGLNGLDVERARERWSELVEERERSTQRHLPLRALREAAGAGASAIQLLLIAGLVEEDPRFGLVFEHLQGAPGRHRPGVALLNAWAEDDGDGRAALRRFQRLGLILVEDSACSVPLPLWDAMRGEALEEPAPRTRYLPAGQLPRFDDLLLDQALLGSLRSVPALLASREVSALILCGPRHNGRHTVARAVARALGRGVLECESRAGDAPGALATLLGALPLFTFDPAPGETVELPEPACYHGPIAVVMGRQGGVAGTAAARAVTIHLEMPGSGLRKEHWRRALGADAPAEIARYRWTSGNIRRAAAVAGSYAALEGRGSIDAAHVRQAARGLNREALDTLATPVATGGDWTQLSLCEETLQDLRVLEARCRHRERLQERAPAAIGAKLNCGVRALFTGPSGTGKTLSARALASVLGMDLYRVDLATVVNKYIGETEKNLNQVLTRAEELDVILLFDEGDALFAQRTQLQSSNDRYANLETNFLLQRLESFEGVLLVTTNAIEHVDTAFQRRMDAVIRFYPPSAAERWAIWQLHLSKDHAVDPALLREAANRCAISGGQIRNAALHCALLALEQGTTVRTAHLRSAIEREYRKAGAVCPLRAEGV